MKSFNVDAILDNIEAVVRRHELENGGYCRYLWQDKAESREMGLNAYGCADAANILYSLNRFHRDPAGRAACVAALQSKQDPATGIFLEPTHYDFHTTAHCVAALDLFDARPLYPLTAMLEYEDISRFFAFLEEVDWLRHGRGSHAGAALFAALAITDSVPDSWLQDYFAFLNDQCNPETGLWSKDAAEDYTLYYQIGEAFHYLFNYEYAREAMPAPERLIDSCLHMYYDGLQPPGFGRQFHYIEMDWAFCLNRASRQTPHRFHEVKEALYDFAKGYIAYLEQVDWERDDSANDLHLLFGTTCCLAELQLALPGVVRSSRPMHMVLDRRPFI
ncbi:MAG: hypothetical protein IJO76_04070 [Clostridia bacterium]|nr:hypothetical protein [Clostridia bacterium]